MLLALIKETYQDTVDEYTMQTYGKEDEALDIEQRREIRRKYPIALLQVLEEMETK